MSTATVSERLRVVGKSPARVDARGKVTGETKYATELLWEGMLHAAFRTSERPHAFLRGLNTEPARGLPGVRAVLTAAEVPGENQLGVIIRDHPALCFDKVRYVGDCIALVAADSPQLARRAAQAVEVQYEDIPGVFGAEEGRVPDAPQIHEKGNICSYFKIRKGDVEDAFRQAEVVIERKLVTGHQEHFYFEPMAGICVPERDGSFSVYGSMQCPYYVQRAVADVLGEPLSWIRVVQTPTGGGFGGKEDCPSEMYARLALLAAATRRPVRLVLEREEDVRMTSKRHPVDMHYKLAARKDGTLLAVRAQLVADAGAYATLTPVVMWRATVHAAGPYRVPHVHVDTYGVHTNHPPSGALRGFGAPQAAFGMESMMDVLAETLGIDPVELRFRNLLEEGDETATGHRLENCEGLKACLEAAQKHSSWDQKRPARVLEQDHEDRYRRGLGVSLIHYGNSLGAKGWHLDAAGAIIQVYRDGSVSVAIGNTEMGQGAFTVLSQIAAEALSLPLNRIHLRAVDTSLVPDSGPTVASRATIMSGNAILDAAAKLRVAFRRVAAAKLGGDPENLTWTDGLIANPVTGAELTFEELAAECYQYNVQMLHAGWYSAPASTFDTETGLGSAYFEYSYACHVAEVVVDTITGRVQVQKVTAVHDLGRALHPIGVEGQIEGGVVQGLGYALYEQLQLEKGVIQNPNFTTYILPTVLDSPEVETVILEYPSKHGPLGARSLAEPCLIPTPAAVANAVRHATGAWIDRIPMTPEVVWKAMKGSVGRGA